MVHFVVETLLSIGATIAGWFWDPDTHNFAVIKMGIAVVVFTLLVIFITFWPFFWWLKYVRRRASKSVIRREETDLPDHAPSHK